MFSSRVCIRKILLTDPCHFAYIHRTCHFLISRSVYAISCIQKFYMSARWVSNCYPNVQFGLRVILLNEEWFILIGQAENIYWSRVTYAFDLSNMSGDGVYQSMTCFVAYSSFLCCKCLIWRSMFNTR